MLPQVELLIPPPAQLQLSLIGFYHPIMPFHFQDNHNQMYGQFVPIVKYKPFVNFQKNYFPNYVEKLGENERERERWERKSDTGTEVKRKGNTDRRVVFFLFFFSKHFNEVAENGCRNWITVRNIAPCFSSSLFGKCSCELKIVSINISYNVEIDKNFNEQQRNDNKDEMKFWISKLS